MLQYVLRSTLDYFFASRESCNLSLQIQDELKEKKVLDAKKILFGERAHSEVRTYVDHQTGRQLLRRSWSPPPGTRVVGMIYICHGFTEHMRLYCSLGEYLSNQGYYCFGTDLMGHGKSSLIDGHRAYIEDFAQCRQDILDHISDEKKLMRDFYGDDPVKNLPLFTVAHSMGGMIMIRLALDHPELFTAMVLDGPLIYFGSSPVLKYLPMKPIMSHFNQALGFIRDRFLNPLCQKYVWTSLTDRLRFSEIGSTSVENITNDTTIQKLLKEDHLRHFGGAYVGMLAKFVEEITYNARHLAEEMKTPFCILFGQEDALCNIRGAWEMFLTCQRVSAEDKLLVEFEHAAHQLYLEIPQIRQKAMKDTLEFIQRRTNQDKSKGIFFQAKHYAINLGEKESND